MTSYRIEVGHIHGVRPGNIVGAIANEAGIDSAAIGRIDIRPDHSLVDLPDGLPKRVLEHLRKTWVSGRQLRIHEAGEIAEKPLRRSKPDQKTFPARQPPKPRKKPAR